MYFKRDIDRELSAWRQGNHKPLLLRGARQIGKSSSIRNLGKSFEHFIEINLEKQPELCTLFEEVHDVRSLAAQLSLITGIPIEPGKTLLFIDEIQACQSAIKSLWFFKEDYPELHVAAAGSLLEFALKEISSFGVGRIRSMFMYPFSFGEFLDAIGKGMMRNAIESSNVGNPLPDVVHDKIAEELRKFIVIGGMPASIKAWVETLDFLECASEQQDIIQSYYDDFPKYAKKIDPGLLRNTLTSVMVQSGGKFMYSKVDGGYRVDAVKKALELLCYAGIIKEVKRSSANGLPLGAEDKGKYRKYLYIDTGLMLRMQSFSAGGAGEETKSVLIDSVSDLVNKGAVAEIVVGWELVKGSTPRLKHELYYWENITDGASSEVDYVLPFKGKVLPVEVKAGTSGKMKSLRYFMDIKNIQIGVRTSMENYGVLESKGSDGAERRVEIMPIYAIYKLTK